jgi:hypothetical protein
MVKALVLKYGRSTDVGPLSCLEELRENLKILFGIALSVQNDFLTRIMACHALCACKNSLGSQFRASGKQFALSLCCISCYVFNDHPANDVPYL